MFTHSGVATIINGMAIVTLNGLACGVTYTITAGGTLNGQLVGHFIELLWVLVHQELCQLLYLLHQ